MIRVLLVDDDALVRSGLRMMLAGAASLEVVAEAADGREVLGAVDLHRPDIEDGFLLRPTETAEQQRYQANHDEYSADHVSHCHAEVACNRRAVVPNRGC